MNTYSIKLLLVIFIFSISTNLITAQSFEWAGKISGNSTEYGLSITTDALGNVYTTGRFFGTVDFDPSPATFTMSSVSGSGDAYVLKLDALGNFVWAKRLGGAGNEIGYGIDVDASGNIYTTGCFTGIADFDPSALLVNLTSFGSNDIFISKLDPSGNFVWAKQLGGTGDDIAFSITLDPSGNIYTTGHFQNTSDFDPSAGIADLSSAGLKDIFVSKLDALGGYVWGKNMGGTGDDIGYAIAVDLLGNVLTTGYFQSISDFDPAVPAINLTSAGGNDIFLSKLNATGDYVNALPIGGSANEYGRSIATDGSNNIYVSGAFQSTNVDFNPGAGNYILSANVGNDDVFTCKFDAADNFVWANSIGGLSQDRCYSISVDNSGNVYSIGSFFITVDFDPGPSTYNLTSNLYEDIFITKTNTLGNFVWAKTFGGAGLDIGYAITVNASNDILSTGRFQDDTVDFNPGWGVHQLVAAAGTSDGFIQKLNPCGLALVTTNNISTCDVPYTWPANGVTYSMSGTYEDTLISMNGCDSMVSLILAINSSDSIIENLSACDSYTWSVNSNTYNTSGTYTASFTNIHGCDSMRTLNLTVNYSNASSETTTACDNYTWSANGTNYTSSGTYVATLSNISGCDSVVTLNLTINYGNSGSANISTCDSYTWSANGTNYTISGTYMETLTNITGCDSIVTLNLTVNNSYLTNDIVTECNSYSWPWNGQTYTISGNYSDTLNTISGCDSIRTLDLTINSIDTSVTLTGSAFTSNTMLATYQWIDCNNSYLPIPGETSQTYYATANGSYAVIVSMVGCATDTSACHGLFNYGIDPDVHHNFTIYPNPTSDKIFIASTITDTINYEVYDVHGASIMSGQITNQNGFIDLEKFSTGFYFIKINYQVFKIIKN